MSFFTGSNYCDKCGKPLSIFEQGLCAECEKKALLDEPNTVVGCIPTIEAYRQVCKERDIAIEQLHELGYQLGQKIEPCDDDYQTDMDEAWKQAKRKPCDDVVSRQAVLDCATLITSIPTEDWDIGDWVCLFRDRVSQLPSVTQEPKTGHWIRQDNTKEPLYGWYFCSECNSVIGDKTKFCSNCGARMVEPQEKRCADCSHYGKLSLDCGRCDDDCSMYEPQESEE